MHEWILSLPHSTLGKMTKQQHFQQRFSTALNFTVSSLIFDKGIIFVTQLFMIALSQYKGFVFCFQLLNIQI